MMLMCCCCCIVMIDVCSLLDGSRLRGESRLLPAPRGHSKVPETIIWPGAPLT